MPDFEKKIPGPSPGEVLSSDSAADPPDDASIALEGDADTEADELAAFHEAYAGPGTLHWRDANLQLPHERIRDLRGPATSIPEQFVPRDQKDRA